MSDKNFKVKNGLTIQGTIDTLITPDNAGGLLIGGSPLASYAAPTLGSTSIGSGSTNTTLVGFTKLRSVAFTSLDANSYEQEIGLMNIMSAW